MEHYLIIHLFIHLFMYSGIKNYLIFCVAYVACPLNSDLCLDTPIHIFSENVIFYFVSFISLLMKKL